MKTERIKSLLTMALRCEYVEGLTLTKKGWGHLTAKQWRVVDRVKRNLFPKWKKDMITLFESVDRINKIQDLSPHDRNVSFDRTA